MVKLEEFYATSLQYFRDVRLELRKVTFPTRKETLASTIVVLVAVGIISAYLGIIDFVLARILHGILR